MKIFLVHRIVLTTTDKETLRVSVVVAPSIQRQVV